MSDVTKTIIAMLNELQDHHYVKQLILLSHKSANYGIAILDIPTDFHKVLTTLSKRKVFDQYEPNAQFSKLVYYKLYKPALFEFYVEEFATSLAISFDQNIHHFPKQVMKEVEDFAQDFQPLSSEEFVFQLQYLNSQVIDSMYAELQHEEYDSVRSIQKHLNKDLSEA